VSETYRLLYPEAGIITASKIMNWHADAVANGEVEGGLESHDVRGAIDQMEDAGLITIARTR